LNAIFADMFSASAVMAVGGGLFTAVIILSVGNGQLRRMYFPGPVLAPVGAD